MGAINQINRELILPASVDWLRTQCKAAAERVEMTLAGPLVIFTLKQLPWFELSPFNVNFKLP